MMIQTDDSLNSVCAFLGLNSRAIIYLMIKKLLSNTVIMQ